MPRTRSGRRATIADRRHPEPAARGRMRRHAVYRLAPDLLLVFKPRGHAESEHAHPHAQRLRVLRGRLSVRTRARTIRLGPRSRSLTLAAGRLHATTALADTWLVAERVRPASQCRSR